jgi:hypothetical protein
MSMCASAQWWRAKPKSAPSQAPTLALRSELGSQGGIDCKWDVGHGWRGVVGICWSGMEFGPLPPQTEVGGHALADWQLANSVPHFAKFPRLWFQVEPGTWARHTTKHQSKHSDHPKQNHILIGAELMMRDCRL